MTTVQFDASYTTLSNMERNSCDSHLKTTVNKVHNYFKQYCNSTSIHGFRYFGEDRSTFEKVWWIIIFIICLSGCSIMIYKVFEKYEASPVIVTFATKETSIYKIPFPAVTICPEIKSERAKFNLTELLTRKEDINFSSTEGKYLQYASRLCDEQLWDGHSTYSFNNDLFASLDEMKPKFVESFLYCKMGQNVTSNCADFFTPVLTDEGVCYSFNILDRGHIFNDFVYRYKNYHKVENDIRSWNMEKGYLDDSKMWVYPWRALFSGATNGLTVYMAVKNEDIDFLCKDVQGFKVVLHSPVRIPRLKQEYFRVSLNQAVVAAVQPIMITTSEKVKQFDVDKRDCYFPSERKLTYFRTYSQQNCLLECLTTITLKKCECVDFFMPRNNETNICDLGAAECVAKSEEAFQLGELYSMFEVSNSETSFTDCDCLPLCTDLSYNVAISQTKWDWKETAKSKVATFDENLYHLSSLTVYFKFNHFITSERQELYGPTDFVANFGGLLGLFTGFSILSLMEIIYFLTIRICCNIRLYKRWTGDK